MKLSVSIFTLYFLLFPVADAIKGAQGYDAPPLSNIFVSPSGKFAVAATADGTNALFALWTPGSNITGWVGIGIGSNMTGADIYIGWFAENKSAMVSDRTGTGHTQPTLDAQQQLSILSTIPPTLSQYLPSTLSIANETVIVFSRPLTPVGSVNTRLSATEGNQLIYAYNPNKPVNGVFQQHSEFGVISALTLTGPLDSINSTGSNISGKSKLFGASELRAIQYHFNVLNLYGNMMRIWRDYPTYSVSGSFFLDIPVEQRYLTSALVCGSDFLNGNSPVRPIPTPMPIGAIIGGSVDGFVVFAIIGVFVYLFIRRRRASRMGNYQQIPQPPTVDHPIFYNHSNVPKDSAGAPTLTIDPNTGLYYWNPPPSFPQTALSPSNSPPQSPVMTYQAHPTFMVSSAAQVEIPQIMHSDGDNNAFIPNPATFPSDNSYNRTCNTALESAYKGLLLSCDSQTAPTNNDWKAWYTMLFQTYCTKSACYNFMPSVASNVKANCSPGYIGNVTYQPPDLFVVLDADSFIRNSQKWTQEQINASPECYSEKGINCISQYFYGIDTNNTKLICNTCTSNMLKTWRDYPATSTSGTYFLNIKEVQAYAIYTCGASFLSGSGVSHATVSPSPIPITIQGGPPSTTTIVSISISSVLLVAIIALITLRIIRRRNALKSTPYSPAVPPPQYPNQPMFYDFGNVPKDPSGVPTLPLDPKSGLYVWNPSTAPSFSQNSVATYPSNANSSGTTVAIPTPAPIDYSPNSNKPTESNESNAFISKPV
ncbi:hypothetical protein HK098_003773 [Nowakowskiella sp. JEL0407]|nr:hypothetical protein HK098_003773 [Nowakowskiella sp. JEL0407]